MMSNEETDIKTSVEPILMLPWEQTSPRPAVSGDNIVGQYEEQDAVVASVNTHIPHWAHRKDLIIAAGTAAHEAIEWEMGVDPVAMIEHAPDALLALDRITYALLHDAEITQGDDDEYLGQVREKIDALQQARRE